MESLLTLPCPRSRASLTYQTMRWPEGGHQERSTLDWWALGGLERAIARILRKLIQPSSRASKRASVVSLQGQLYDVRQHKADASNISVLQWSFALVEGYTCTVSPKSPITRTNPTLGSRGFSLSEIWGQSHRAASPPAPRCQCNFSPRSPRARNLWSPGYTSPRSGFGSLRRSWHWNGTAPHPTDNWQIGARAYLWFTCDTHRPVIRANGFLLSSGSQRNRVKSSEPETNLSDFAPWGGGNK